MKVCACWVSRRLRGTGQSSYPGTASATTSAITGIASSAKVIDLVERTTRWLSRIHSLRATIKSTSRTASRTHTPIYAMTWSKSNGIVSARILLIGARFVELWLGIAVSISPLPQREIQTVRKARLRKASSFLPECTRVSQMQAGWWKEWLSFWSAIPLRRKLWEKISCSKLCPC